MGARGRRPCPGWQPARALAIWLQIVSWRAGGAAGQARQCTADLQPEPGSWDYRRVFQAAPPGPPGLTRSVYERDHALITSESRVWAALPGWHATETAHLVSPTHLTGAKFAMFLAVMGQGGVMGPLLPGVERLVVVLGGAADFSSGGAGQERLGPGTFAFLPPGANFSLAAPQGAQLLVYEQRYQLAGAASLQVRTGAIDEQPLVPVPGEVFRLRKLLPVSPAHDFNIHVMDFLPGEYLQAKEVHYNQHGLLLAQGEGIYRLGERWYPVTTGDAIYMAPYSVQWYGALGTVPSRYILYKDTAVDPLFSSLGHSMCT